MICNRVSCSYSKYVHARCCFIFIVHICCCFVSFAAISVTSHRAKAPSYARIPEINTHPLVTHPYIELPPCSAQEGKGILLRVQNHMVDSHDYVRCSDVATDWEVRRFIKTLRWHQAAILVVLAHE